MDTLSDIGDDIDESMIERQRERIISVVETAVLAQSLAEEANEMMGDEPKYVRTAMNMEALVEDLEGLYQVMALTLVRMGGEPMTAEDIKDRSAVFEEHAETAENGSEVDRFVGETDLDGDGEDAPETPGFQ